MHHRCLSHYLLIQTRILPEMGPLLIVDSNNSTSLLVVVVLAEVQARA